MLNSTAPYLDAFILGDVKIVPQVLQLMVYVGQGHRSWHRNDFGRAGAGAARDLAHSAGPALLYLVYHGGLGNAKQNSCRHASSVGSIGRAEWLSHRHSWTLMRVL